MKLGDEKKATAPQQKRLLSGLKEWWQKQDPAKQRKIALWGIVTLLVLILLGGYSAWKKPKATPAPETKAGKKILKLDASQFERSLYSKTTQELSGLKQQIADLQAELKRLQEQPPSPPEEEPKSPEAVKAVPAEPERESPKPRFEIPPPPQVSLGQESPSCAEGTCNIPPPPSHEELSGVSKPSGPSYQVIGDIAVVKGKGEEKKEDEKKREQSLSKVYLPPSFMEATLLSGIAAPAMGEGLKNPIPVLLRIHDLAVLPNSVKANLKGCFVIGEATGNLADERAHVRLVTLSCVAKNGEAVIDQKVKGFVVDSDGKVGLKGHVVSRMGAAIARAALAGLFGGIGEGISWSSFNVWTSPEGAAILSENDFKNMARAGIGKGIQQAAEELQKFYLELARQTIPVVEVGATKKVTVVISEGVDLEIKEQKVVAGGKSL